MQTVLIVIHLMIVVSLVGVVLLQRSEGGGLGMGGGSGFMTARGAANALTRATAILATGFFVTSLLLSILARYGDKPSDTLDLVPAATTNKGTGVIDQLGAAKPAAPVKPGVPAASDPVAPATPVTPAAVKPAAQEAPATTTVVTPATPAVPAASDPAAPAAVTPAVPAVPK